MHNTSSLSAELFIATGCNHCPAVLQALCDLLKKGQLASLQVTNIAVDNQRASELGIRSVPWLHLGKFVLPGAYTPAELQRWTELAATTHGMSEYIDMMLANGELAPVLQALKLHPDQLAAVIPLLRNDETSMQVRIGIDALLEQFSTEPALKALIPELSALVQLDNPRLQIDALHYLALTAEPSVEPVLLEQTNSAIEIIKEAADEALQTYHDLRTTS